VPVVSRETFDELRAVLEYPKFELTKGEIREILEEEVLLFFEVGQLSTDTTGFCPSGRTSG
jgi:predicted nucleic acid-binding protein